MPDRQPSSHKFSRRTLFRFAGAASMEHFFGEIPSVAWAETDKTPESVRKFIETIVINPPLIGTNQNAGKNLDFGKGWATFHLDENSPIMQTVINNRLKSIQNHPTISKEDQNILQLKDHKLTEFIVEKQSHLSIAEALASKKYLGAVATRGTHDIGQEYVVFTQKTSTAPIEFTGIALCVDNSGDAKNLYKPYKLDGWNKAGYKNTPLEWMLDASANLIKNLPLGRAPSSDYLMSGRPGVIVISRPVYDNLVSN